MLKKESKKTPSKFTWKTPAKTPKPVQSSGSPLANLLFHLKPKTPKIGVRNINEVNQEDLDNEPVKTYLRIRPIPGLKKEEETVMVLNETRVKLVAPLSSHAFKTKNRHEGEYMFSKVFDTLTTQKELFDVMAKPIVEDVLAGDNRTIAAYGVSGAGKSHSVYGTLEDPGIVLRAIRYILSAVGDMQTDLKIKPIRFDEFDFNDQEETPTCPDESLAVHWDAVEDQVELDDALRYSVWITAFENYNERLYDLLSGNQKTRGPLEVKRTAKSQTFIDGLKKYRVRSCEEALSLLEKVKNNRQVFSTLMNDASSRSHGILCIEILSHPEGVDPRSDEFQTMISRLTIVDLAGSERNKQTNTSGIRIKEAGGIMKSLSTLQNCILAIRASRNQKNAFIPYRNSKLTQILENDLSSLKFSMIINVNPSPSCFDETSHIMEFSALARELRANKARVDTGLSKSVKKRLMFPLKQKTEPVSFKTESPVPEPDETNMEESCPGQTNVEDNDNNKVAMLVPVTEGKIRDQVATEYMHNVDDLLHYYEKLLQESLEDQEDKMNAKIDVICESYDNEINKLKSKIKHLNKHLYEKDETIAALQAKNDSEQFESLVKATETQMKQLELQTEREIGMFKGQIDMNKQLIDSLKTKLGASKDDNDALKKEISELRSEIQRMNKELNEKESEITRLRNAFRKSFSMGRISAIPASPSVKFESPREEYRFVCQDEDGIFAVRGEAQETVGGGVSVRFDDVEELEDDVAVAQENVNIEQHITPMLASLGLKSSFQTKPKLSKQTTTEITSSPLAPDTKKRRLRKKKAVFD